MYRTKNVPTLVYGTNNLNLIESPRAFSSDHPLHKPIGNHPHAVVNLGVIVYAFSAKRHSARNTLCAYWKHS